MGKGTRTDQGRYQIVRGKRKRFPAAEEEPQIVVDEAEPKEEVHAVPVCCDCQKPIHPAELLHGKMNSFFHITCWNKLHAEDMSYKPKPTPIGTRKVTLQGIPAAANPPPEEDYPLGEPIRAEPDPFPEETGFEQVDLAEIIPDPFEMGMGSTFDNDVKTDPAPSPAFIPEQKLQQMVKDTRKHLLHKHGIDPSWSPSSIVVHVHAHLHTSQERKTFDDVVRQLESKDELVDAALLFLDGAKPKGTPKPTADPQTMRASVKGQT